MKSTLVYPSHPQTGLRAIHLTAQGEPLWLLMGADGEDEGSETDDTEESEEETDESEDSEEDEGKPAAGTVARAEYDKLKERMKASDKRRAGLESELNTLKKKGMEEGERTKVELQEMTAERDKLLALNRTLAVTNAFNIASQQAKIVWEDPEVALAAGKFGELEIDDDGNVDGMLDAVKELAKKKKFLVATKSDSESDEESEGEKLVESGSKVGSRRKAGGNGKKTYTKEELQKRFPALRY